MAAAQFLKHGRKVASPSLPLPRAHTQTRSWPSVETTPTTPENSAMRSQKNLSSSSSRHHPTCHHKLREQSCKFLAGSWPTMKVLLFLLALCFHNNTSTVELGVVIGTPGRDVPREDAPNHIAGYSQSLRPPQGPSAYRYQPLPST